MKKLIIVIYLIPFLSNAQIDTTINLDQLRTINSPAAVLLGISPNQVQKPSEVKTFNVFLSGATAGYSAIPRNFAVDISPFQLFDRNTKLNQKFHQSDKIGENIKESFVVSLGSKTYQVENSLDSSQQVGIGFKISLKRGTFKQKDVDSFVTEFSNFHFDAFNSFESLKKKDSTYQSLEKIIRNGGASEVTKDSLKARENFLKNEAIKSKKLKEKLGSISKYHFNRYGFKWDVASGMVIDFPNLVFKNGSTNTGGLWTMMGFDDIEKKVSILGMYRILYNPDKSFLTQENIIISENTWSSDFGLRLSLANEQLQNFEVNAEYMYRSFLKSDIKPTYRLITNFSYKPDFLRNTALTFSFGRDFDKKTYKDGNLVAFLNLISGFGK